MQHALELLSKYLLSYYHIPDMAPHIANISSNKTSDVHMLMDHLLYGIEQIGKHASMHKII